VNSSEQQVIRNVIRRLRGEHSSEEVTEALTGPARLYLETWVIPALELLMPEHRDLKLALATSRLPASPSSHN
jgi:hypothetical protein